MASMNHTDVIAALLFLLEMTEDPQLLDELVEELEICGPWAVA